jgi:hypothetical protein
MSRTHLDKSSKTSSFVASLNENDPLMKLIAGCEVDADVCGVVAMIGRMGKQGR